MNENELIWELSLFGLSILGLLTAMTMVMGKGIISVMQYYARRVEVAQAYEVAVIEDVLHEALVVVEEEIHNPTPSYRHNIHCPTCGRFAKRVFGYDNVVNCHKHGVTVRWKDFPVDWAVQAIAPGVTLVREPSLTTQEIAIIPVTAEMEIIVPDDLSELYAEGARI